MFWCSGHDAWCLVIWTRIWPFTRVLVNYTANDTSNDNGHDAMYWVTFIYLSLKKWTCMWSFGRVDSFLFVYFGRE